MQLTEIFDKTEFVNRDTKARRRLNVSDKTANITADEIERGVSIERLESINVPVYQYGTQITIHGSLPDFSNNRVCGYKSIFKNANGSIGVRYVAIDGEKKSVISRASRACKPKMAVQIDSQGFSLVKFFNQREDCVAALKDIPSVFVGSKYGAACAYGGYVAIASIQAVYSEQLWPLVSWLTGGAITSMEQIEAIETAKREQYEREQAAAKLERAAAQKERNENAKAAIANVKPTGADWKDTEGAYVLEYADKVRKIELRKDYSGKMVFGFSGFKVRGPKFKAVEAGLVNVYKWGDVYPEKTS
jgi:hypothetical protein